MVKSKSKRKKNHSIHKNTPIFTYEDHDIYINIHDLQLTSRYNLAA